jgi:hypothetical protein
MLQDSNYAGLEDCMGTLHTQGIMYEQIEPPTSYSDAMIASAPRKENHIKNVKIASAEDQIQEKIGAVNDLDQAALPRLSKEKHPMATACGKVGDKEESELQKTIKMITDQSMEEKDDPPFLWKDGALHDSELGVPKNIKLEETATNREQPLAFIVTNEKAAENEAKTSDEMNEDPDEATRAQDHIFEISSGSEAQSSPPIRQKMSGHQTSPRQGYKTMVQTANRNWIQDSK